MTQRREELAIIRVLGADSASSPETVFFEEMLAGWQSQRLSRNLSFATVEAGARVVNRFADAVGAPPWRWTSESWERWVATLRDRDGLARSTVRSYWTCRRVVPHLRVRPCLWLDLALSRAVRHPPDPDLSAREHGHPRK